MTPTARVFNELLDIVARAYELDTEAITTEEAWPPPPVREARLMALVVGVETLKLTHRQLGKLMQRDHRTLGRGLKRFRAMMAKSLMLRMVHRQVTERFRYRVQNFDVFKAEAAE